MLSDNEACGVHLSDELPVRSLGYNSSIQPINELSCDPMLFSHCIELTSDKLLQGWLMKILSGVALLLFSSCALAKWSAGVATIVPSSPYKGADSEVLAIPIVTYEGERLTWRGPSLSYKLTGLQRNEPSFSLTLNLAPNELDTEDSDRLTGIEDRDFSFMAGLSYRHPFKFGTLESTLETDISGKHDGQRFVLSIERPLFMHAKRKWVVNLGAEVEYLSDNYADYYFGVSTAEENVSDFAAYSVGSVIQPAIKLGGYYQFNKRWMMVANLRWQALSSDIKDSPIVDSNSALDGFLGVIYAF